MAQGPISFTIDYQDIFGITGTTTTTTDSSQVIVDTIAPRFTISN